MAFFLQYAALLVAAYPTQDFTHMARRDMPTVSMDEKSSRRTLVVVLCIAYGFLLALAQGKLALLVLQTCVANTLRLSCRSHGRSKVRYTIL